MVTMVMNVCFKNIFVRNLVNERMFEFSDICPSTSFNKRQVEKEGDQWK